MYSIDDCRHYITINSRYLYISIMPQLEYNLEIFHVDGNIIILKGPNSDDDKLNNLKWSYFQHATTNYSVYTEILKIESIDYINEDHMKKVNSIISSNYIAVLRYYDKEIAFRGTQCILFSTVVEPMKYVATSLLINISCVYVDNNTTVFQNIHYSISQNSNPFILGWRRLSYLDEKGEYSPFILNNSQYNNFIYQTCGLNNNIFDVVIRVLNEGHIAIVFNPHPCAAFMRPGFVYYIK